MLLKELISGIFIFMNLQREDEINILKYYCTDNCTIELVNSQNVNILLICFHLPTKIPVRF